MSDPTTKAARDYARRVKAGPLTQEERASHRQLIHYTTELCAAIRTDGLGLSLLLRSLGDDTSAAAAEELSTRLMELRRFVKQLAIPMALVAEASPEEPITILEED